MAVKTPFSKIAANVIALSLLSFLASSIIGVALGNYTINGELIFAFILPSVLLLYFANFVKW